MKAGSSVEKIKILETKIIKVIDKIKAVSDENDALRRKIQDLQEELKKKDDASKTKKQDLKNIDKLKNNIDSLNAERETVKSQIGALIKELEAVEV